MNNAESLKVTAGVLAQLGEMAVRAEFPTILKVPDGPEHHSLLVTRDANGVHHEVLTAGPRPRAHVFESVGAFLNFVKALIDGGHGDANPCVWYGTDGLTAVVDDGTRRDRGHLLLGLAPPFIFLSSGQSASPRTQGEFIRMLRIYLAGTLPAGSTLLALLRNIKFAHGDKGETEIQHGRESMGREITQSVFGLAALPEEIDLFVPVFAVPDAQQRHRIRCALDIVVAERTFGLVPLPLECENARAEALATIGERITAGVGESAPVYFGAPE